MRSFNIETVFQLFKKCQVFYRNDGDYVFLSTVEDDSLTAISHSIKGFGEILPRFADCYTRFGHPCTHSC
jgi:hypothetical protein